jgi:thiamine-monophosphate kinase
MPQRFSEDELIARFFGPLAGPAGLGLLDDAACMTPPPGHDLVLTKDLVIAGVHFFPDDPPGDIARKALRVNLSDLAAKAAEPLGFLLGLALPDDWNEDWLAAFAAGLAADVSCFGVPLLGGDTVKTSGPLAISVTAIGAVPTGSMVPRGGTLPGDLIYVTGTIGDAALGLKLCHSAAQDRDWIDGLDSQASDFLGARYLLPQPRSALSTALRLHAHAAMDISDGLAGDLAKMLRLSGTTVELSIAEVPLSFAAETALALAPHLVETILTGGDDYEILCAVPLDRSLAFEAAAVDVAVEVTRIAVAKIGQTPPIFKDRRGSAMALTELSFQHF